MIKITRIDNTKLVINSDLIETVEAIPETMICLTTGKKIMVRETVDEVIDGVVAFRRISLSGPRITITGGKEEENA
jgi:flagellar protein FlbD